MKYTCYIIDDEPLAIRVIEEYVRRLSDLQLVGTSTDPVRAFGEIAADSVDLLFLDIEMPGLSGLELLKALNHQPEVIVTTAYRDYAVEGFELNLLDYLVKPIPFPRFMQAIDRFFEKTTRHQAQLVEPDHMFIRADRKSVKVSFEDILYIQGVKDYVKVVTQNGNFLTKLSVGQIEEQLPPDRFTRIHKSFIVSNARVTAITHHDVELGEIEVPIGRTYRERVQDAFGV